MPAALTVLPHGIDLASPAAGPKPVRSLRSRGDALSSPQAQIATLDALPLGDPGAPADFATSLRAAGLPPLVTGSVDILQINVGKLCNMTCRHCHVDAGPDRTENMDWATMQRCLAALDRLGATTVDLTGGAPELNPHFRDLVDACVARGVHVIDRCNLTVLLLPKNVDLPKFLADRGVEVVCSLPHHRPRNTDAQRGEGTYERSIEALRRLNAVGYGQGDPRRRLTLMTNPAGAFLAPEQAGAEIVWKQALERQWGVTFDRLIALNNMPISRFLDWLLQTGNLAGYMDKLLASFNPGAVDGLMCRNTLSVGWDGAIFDCDFNQMLELPARADGRALRIEDVARDGLTVGRSVAVGRHCYGCTAGAGSSCAGATA